MSGHRSRREALELLAAAVARLPDEGARAILGTALGALVPAPVHPDPAGLWAAQVLGAVIFGTAQDPATLAAAEGVTNLAAAHAAMAERTLCRRADPARADTLRHEAGVKGWKARCLARDALAVRTTCDSHGRASAEDGAL